MERIVEYRLLTEEKGIYSLEEMANQLIAMGFQPFEGPIFTERDGVTKLVQAFVRYE